MRTYIYTFILLNLSACTVNNETKPALAPADSIAVSAMLDSFHLAAANADFEEYFSFFAEDAVFIGTDATERWDKNDFMNWAKPFFERKKAWRFLSVKRHIHFSCNEGMAWFDELLHTQMKICRGSGIVEKVNKRWLIKQYVLSMTIPNSKTDTVVQLKAAEEDLLLKEIQ